MSDIKEYCKIFKTSHTITARVLDQISIPMLEYETIRTAALYTGPAESHRVLPFLGYVLHADARVS